MKNKITIKENKSSVVITSEIDNAREIRKYDDDYYLSGIIKNSERFREKIKDTLIISLIDEENDIVDFVISKNLIIDITKIKTKDLYDFSLQIDGSKERVEIRTKKGFLLILKKDYPTRLLNGIFVK